MFQKAELNRRDFWRYFFGIAAGATTQRPFWQTTVCYMKFGRYEIETISKFYGIPYAVRKGR